MNSNNSGQSLWDRVSKTDAKYTKGFSRGGGFKGTAINATWLVREATKVFGPCGIGWGFNVIDEKYAPGSDGDVIHVVRLRLWYEMDGKRGEVEQYGQTTFAGSNKNGRFTDEEAPKKSITDAMSKCLSLLGFGADIHLGLWDDNKYAAERQGKAGSSDGEQRQRDDGKKVATPAEYAELVKKYADTIIAIRDGLKEGTEESIAAAYEAWQDVPNDDKERLWKAPSNGGCFTTEERALMQKPAWREAYFKLKGVTQ